MEKLIIILTIVMFSGCTGKQLKDVGGSASNGGVLGLIVGLPIYGIGVIVENNEEKKEKQKEDNYSNEK